MLHETYLFFEQEEDNDDEGNKSGVDSFKGMDVR